MHRAISPAGTSLMAIRVNMATGEVKGMKEQILIIRETGITNMFDLPVVQRLAYERDFFELVIFLEEHPKEYVHFILTGEA